VSEKQQNPVTRGELFSIWLSAVIMSVTLSFVLTLEINRHCFGLQRIDVKQPSPEPK
jgi:hypothetical protein